MEIFHCFVFYIINMALLSSNTFFNCVYKSVYRLIYSCLSYMFYKIASCEYFYHLNIELPPLYMFLNCVCEYCFCINMWSHLPCFALSNYVYRYTHFYKYGVASLVLCFFTLWCFFKYIYHVTSRLGVK